MLLIFFHDIIATIFNAIILILPMVGVWGEVAKAPCLFSYTIIRDPGDGLPGPLSTLFGLGFGTAFILLISVNIYIQIQGSKKVNAIEKSMKNVDDPNLKAINAKAIAIEKVKLSKSIR